MPDNVASSSPDAVEEAMRRLNLEENPDGVDDAHGSPYPDRPGEPDCMYYLRTGLCGYGNNCRYNHPTHIGLGTQYTGELPERTGQPDCQYFLKTGTCKYGPTCKYHHPRDKHDSRPVLLNIYGLPMRQDEKSCPYYMRTGSCKFGMACKFHHPQPAAPVGAIYPTTGSSSYGFTGSSMATPTSLPLLGGLSAWTLSRPPYVSNNMQGLPAYMPVTIPPSQGAIHLQHGWSTYVGNAGHAPSTDVLGLQMSNSKQHSQSGSSNQPYFPERPDQPECQYYMKTGSCKYGTSCKYNHPKERNISLANYTVGPHGLPLRPGMAACTFYNTYGSCKYGSACKYDHPFMGYYNYNLPAYSTGFNTERNPQTSWSSVETLPSRASRFNDQQSGTSNGTQDVDKSVDGDHSAKTSPTHTEPYSEPPQDHSN
ncbi:zinc finger CCCH domain-containing protein ZFN-like [Dioscorea cayenensis subsp. rotundata]|uniref:Zinc finger CCCH domain-containing protein ZFN-like n=1 Tax=Dioscorea cayennensis subsp. rotundata TaxID=55577 RepID=A0AB40CPC1_DIOCR|nr:zinc finger CCCH domain-containing protein ZFN-like [Dioscorea cayenensis subsp. rotundata]